ncbi:GntR family transcriptional regulator [Arthrobacter sp. S39]|uniref:GntR family transcriptional regulator n=1 Tax=Arthrobacter sp. S39 TaxID=2509720 RepID=UPI001037AAAE|nr:GntR family transcriptional regulator [Arthrobacter sp. S39]TAP42780.1 GntR family transcriptional regulator [Arthrobacter sp. S39]
MFERRSLAAQVADSFRQRIGEDLHPGDRLPGEKDLAVELGVSRTTLRDALQLLWKEGIVVRRHGIGTFIRETGGPVLVSLSDLVAHRDVILASGHEPAIAEFVLTRSVPSRDISSLIALEDGEEAWKVERVFSVDGIRAVKITDTLPVSVNGVALDLEPLKDIDVDMIHLLQEQARCPVLLQDGDLDVVPASEELATVFDIKPDTPLLKLTQLNFTDEERPFMHSVIYNRSDVMKFRLIRRPSH